MSIQRAYNLFLSYQFDKSLTLAQSILDAKPNHHEALYVKGLALKELNRKLESLKCFQLALSYYPTDVCILKEIAEYYFDNQNYEAALDFYDKCLNYAGANYVFLNRVGECHANLGRIQESITHFEQSIQLYKHEETYIHLANSYIKNGEDFKAESLLQDAQEISEEHAETLLLMSVLSDKKGDESASRDFLMRLLNQNPHHPQGLLKMAKLHQNKDEYDEAITKYQLLIKLGYSDKSIWKEFAMCYFGKKRYLMATSILEKANQLYPGNACILYHLGLCSYYIDRKVSSYQYLKSCLQVEPSHSTASDLLKKVINELGPL